MVDESPLTGAGNDGINPATGDYSGNFATTNDYGTDGAGSVDYALALNGATSSSRRTITPSIIART